MGVLKDVSLSHQTGAPAVVLAKSDPLMFGPSLADVFSAPGLRLQSFRSRPKA